MFASIINTIYEIQNRLIIVFFFPIDDSIVHISLFISYTFST